MACRIISAGPGHVVIACGRRRSQPPCSCGRPSVALCDFELRGRKAGKTCDKPLCEACRVRKGPDRDFCPAHEAMALGAPGEQQTLIPGGEGKT